MPRARVHPVRPPGRGRIRRMRCVVCVLVAVLTAATCSRREPAGIPSDAFTLYVLGGSVALGHPYEGRADFGRIAAWLCHHRIGGRLVHVENVAGKGKTAAVCVDDAHRIAQHPAERGTAAAFIYIGNNEFITYERKQDLSRRSPRAQFDVAMLSDSERQYVHARSRAALTEIIQSLRDANIEPIVATVAVNAADWEPNRSVLERAEHAESVRAMLQAGEAALRAGDPRAAGAHFEAVLALEPRFALACKRAGDCSRALGEPALARAFYQRAVDCDAGPNRDTTEQNRIVREVCAAHDVMVVDAPGILSATSQDGLVGWNFMWDNCHPTLDGYGRIAEGFVDALAAKFDVSDRRPFELAAAQTALGVDAEVNRQVFHVAGQYCYRTAVLIFDPRARLERSRHYLLQATSLGAEDADITCSLAVLALIENDATQALEHWRRAWQLDAHVARERAGNRYVMQLLEARGLESAVAALQ